MAKNTLHIFRAGSEQWEIDTCEPLKQASEEGGLLYRAYGHGPYPGDKFATDELPEIRNIGFWDCSESQHWGLDWHRNEGIEFTFVLHGSVDFETSNHAKKLDAGMLAITPPWVKHKLGSPTIGPSKLFWIILDVQVRRPNETWVWPDWVILEASELARIEELIQSNDFAIPVSKKLLTSIEKLQDLVEHQHTPEHISQLKVSVNQLLIDLLEHDAQEQYTVAENTSLNQSSKTIDIFLHELPNYLSIPWTVESMAFECGMGKTAFTKIIKQKTNKTPMQHLNDVRLEAAATLLQESGTLVKEVAQQMSYRSSEYFCKCFRKKFGISPSQFMAKR
ncbi:AraC family transcriptional regulator [Rubritalea marina]|uniref:AraC family transcriptional regulator n=1 Tax=Rubritalea marina TaxID=361055 RepID=UPI00036A51E5|nr:AraC family transcriptional regulator [Rubritalea marina]